MKIRMNSIAKKKSNSFVTVIDSKNETSCITYNLKLKLEPIIVNKNTLFTVYYYGKRFSNY